MYSYPINIQVLLIYCCAIIHNFIGRHQSIPDGEFDAAQEEIDLPNKNEVEEALARSVGNNVSDGVIALLYLCGSTTRHY